MQETQRTEADGPLAVLHVSAPRRWAALAALVALGLLFLWLALARPPEGVGWRFVLLGAGGGALWLTMRMHAATALRLELTPVALRDSAGRVLAPVAEIVAVSGGVFALKPSGGFVLRLGRAAPAGWAPGLWWRIGGRLGVGGVTSRTEARYMAEAIAALVAARAPR